MHDEIELAAVHVARSVAFMRLSMFCPPLVREMDGDHMRICHVNLARGVGNLLLTGDLMCTCSVLLNVRPGRRDRSVSRFVREYTLFIQTWRRWSWCVYKGEQEKFDFLWVMMQMTWQYWKKQYERCFLTWVPTNWLFRYPTLFFIVTVHVHVHHSCF